MNELLGNKECMKLYIWYKNKGCNPKWVNSTEFLIRAEEMAFDKYGCHHTGWDKVEFNKDNSTFESWHEYENKYGNMFYAR